MDVFGKVWRHHEKKIEKYVNRMVSSEDTLVITGDHSWGRNLEECRLDLEFIRNLPGRKILLRGNHDMFWDAKKTRALNERFNPELFFLQDNYYAYEDYALVGTKGYTFEGPFYYDAWGNLMGWDEDRQAHAEKLVEREMTRLRRSFDSAASAGYKKFIMFLHYPPTNIIQTNSIFTKLAEQYGVSQVIYGHCHGETRFHDSITGKKRRIRYSLVSGDALRWKPLKVLD